MWISQSCSSAPLCGRMVRNRSRTRFLFQYPHGGPQLGPAEGRISHYYDDSDYVPSGKGSPFDNLFSEIWSYGSFPSLAKLFLLLPLSHHTSTPLRVLICHTSLWKSFSVILYCIKLFVSFKAVLYGCNCLLLYFYYCFPFSLKYKYHGGRKHIHQYTLVPRNY